MRLKTKTITENAIIACIYALLTLMIAPLAYSEIQFRISEIMVFLAFYNKRLNPGLIIGCLLANLSSPLGAYDIVFGTLSTIVVGIWMNRTNNLYFAALGGGLVTGFIIGFELHLAFGLPFILNVIYVAIGEFVVLIIGAVAFSYIERNKKLMQYLKEG